MVSDVISFPLYSAAGILYIFIWSSNICYRKVPVRKYMGTCMHKPTLQQLIFRICTSMSFGNQFIWQTNVILKYLSQAPLHDPSLAKVLRCLLRVKKVQTIVDFFTTAYQSSPAGKREETVGKSVYNFIV